jgi:hypothetical protein
MYHNTKNFKCRNPAAKEIVGLWDGIESFQTTNVHI